MDYRSAHPEVVFHKSDDPEKDKEIGDSIALKPVLTDFFNLHQNFKYSTFLGDSAFDSYDTYTMLKNDFHFLRACIPLNQRNSKSSYEHFNKFGNPLCHLTGKQFTCIGRSGGKHRSERIKWVCPESVLMGNTRRCICSTPCTDSAYGKCVYTYPDKDFRAFPGIPRNTDIRIIFINTEFLLKEPLTFSKMLSDLILIDLMIPYPLKLNYSLLVVPNLSALSLLMLSIKLSFPNLFANLLILLLETVTEFYNRLKNN